MAAASSPVYVEHSRAVLCADCGGISDAILNCPCGSSALVNLANILDRVADEERTAFDA
jgi:hypothetical protein